MKTKVDKRILVVSVIFVIIYGGVLFPYFNTIYAQDSKIALLNTQEQNLNNEVANLTSQISSLKGQITNFTTAYLTTALEANEIITSAYTATKSIPYNYLYISGSVTNTGDGMAYNAGLHVVAYDAHGNRTLDIDMTFPLSGGTFGTDSGIDAYVTNSQQYPESSLQLGKLAGGETATINIQIFHEGTVSNWTITPVWTNSP
jgi:hypothetical protein